MADVPLPAQLGGEPLHPMTVLCYEMLGPAMTSGDSAGGWLLLKFMDALVHGMKPVWDMVVSHGDQPGWWDAFNPYARPGEVLPWLPWLAQFTGDIYDESTIGIDPSADSPDQINRNMVAHRRRWNRGSVPTIVETILERIPSGATVQVYEQYQGAVNHMHIVVFVSTDVTQDQQGVLLQAIAASIPAGDTFDLDVLTSPSFAAIEALQPGATFGDLQTRYPRFSDWPAIHEAPYRGQLPIQATDPAVTTWDQLETLIGSWSAIEAYGSWEAIETAGDIFNLEG
jgi:hypothetical protein